MTHDKSEIPEGISKEAWEAAVEWLHQDWDDPRLAMARAIMAATLAEREACAQQAEIVRHPRGNGNETPDWLAGTCAAADAIRQRGEAEMAITRREKNDSVEGARTTYCSFCGKNEHECDVMVKAPLVVICDECVDLCRNIIAEARSKRSAVSTEVNTAHKNSEA